ncbi:Rhodocoxin reductase [Rubripirellula obstinata]|uniref:Rhodocoxin reductase n=1 Tax=Rubripirellula obstinata TaxID=406547 RepID=A0A5B1CLB3_9BACT|nr:FAD-dependent oxidoreductase [Rubripirellula obstinata]KAA1261111.1 Rhodocoxin reductase [Rubripirellula obstinata]
MSAETTIAEQNAEQNAEQKKCVIVGSGHSAAQLCVSLTHAGRSGKIPVEITVIGDEPHAPYHRPPLSKTYLNPAAPEPLQFIRPENFYRENSIEMRLGKRVESIDRQAKQVCLGGETIPYDVLALATGSTHRRPPIPGIDHPDVLTLQTAAQADVIRDRIRSDRCVVVIGAGFIGLEFAASLRKLGVRVAVLERMERVLSRVTSLDVSRFFEAMHRHHGVELHTSVNVTAVDEVEGRLVVRTENGSDFTADFVVVGAGAAPNDQLARQAGLDVDNGVRVNEYNQTSDPDIYAMGDCCNQFHPIYSAQLRIESVQNALDQAKTVAASILGKPVKQNTMPWFWSDQYDVKLQIAGVSTGFDQCLIRGSAKLGESFSAWYLKQGRLLAVDAINDARAYAVAGKLIPTGMCPRLELITDTNITPKELLQSAKEESNA